MSSHSLFDVESSDGDTKRDEIIDAFERQWLEQPQPPDIVQVCQDYLASFSHETESVPLTDFILELAIVDLELSWRRGAPTARRNTDWYRIQLSCFGLNDDQLRTLAFNELEVRSRWGDQPKISTLVREQFPNANNDELTSIIIQFAEELELRFPIVCNISTETEHRYRTTLKTPCIIGRQRSSDASMNDLQYCERDQAMRMVIARREENFISRRQLKIERLSVNQLSLTLLSKSVPSYAENRRLLVNEPTTITLTPRGGIITFGGFIMHLRQA